MAKKAVAFSSGLWNSGVNKCWLKLIMQKFSLQRNDGPQEQEDRWHHQLAPGACDEVRKGYVIPEGASSDILDSL